MPNGKGLLVTTQPGTSTPPSHLLQNPLAENPVGQRPPEGSIRHDRTAEVRNQAMNQGAGVGLDDQLRVGAKGRQTPGIDAIEHLDFTPLQRLDGFGDGRIVAFDDFLRLAGVGGEVVRVGGENGFVGDRDWTVNGPLVGGNSPGFTDAPRGVSTICNMASGRTWGRRNSTSRW